MLDLWSSRRTVFVETGSSKWVFSSDVTCAVVILWFFETILLSVRRSLSANFDLRLLFLFSDDVFPWFVYADITLDTVTLNTPNNVAVFVTDAPAKRGQVSYFPILSHGLSVNKITNVKSRELQSVNNRKKNIQCYHLSSFNVANTNSIRRNS
jgi:hypothetical protein